MAAPSGAAAAPNIGALISNADDKRNRAVIARLTIGHAPVDVIMDTHLIPGPLADIAVAIALAAR